MFQNTFSVIRGKGGFNDNPTMVQARSALRLVTCNNLIKANSIGRNCEDTSLEYLLPTLPSEPEANTGDAPGPSTSFQPVIPARTSVDDVIDSIVQSGDVNTIDDDAYSYITGYNIRRTIKCKTCISALTKPYSDTGFIRHKTFEGCALFNPIDAITRDVLEIKTTVFSLLPKIGHYDNLSKFLVSYEPFSNHFNYEFLHPNCKEAVHTTLLEAFCKFFIRVYCLRKNEVLRSNKQQSLKKYQKLVQ